ncbi:MFS transporter [Streptomyces sp. NBC_01750]|uniref:MFS transporter n=1 Tax=Streptomyces sp. NBC_01750 TaxID=2975928 RepID=UPI002DDC5F33|nr:MFS transporter [Streptomyces sp. NBC_01750]WSD34585.1 MFS transporter [Streptomyces sp. NBC_01750]
MLHPTLRLRIAVGFVERFLNTIITPLMAIYLAAEVGAALAGLLVFLAVGISVAASLFGGPVADAYGRRMPLIVGTAGSALAFGGMALFSSPWINSAISVYLFYVLNTSLSSFALPANEAMIVDTTSSDERKGIYTLQYWSVNVALAAGALTAGFLYADFFAAMLGVAAAIAGTAALVSVRYLAETAPQRPAGQAAPRPSSMLRMSSLITSYTGVLEDSMFLRLVLGMTLWLGIEMQMVGYVAVRLAEDMNPQQFLSIDIDGYRMLGILRSENTLLIVILAFFSERLLRHLPDGRRAYWGIALFAAGMAALGFSNSVMLLLIAVAALTVGELMHIPVMQAMLADLVPEQSRTTYLAVFKLSIQGGLIIASLGLSLSAVLPPWGMAASFVAMAALIIVSYRPVIARLGQPTAADATDEAPGKTTGEASVAESD